MFYFIAEKAKGFNLRYDELQTNYNKLLNQNETLRVEMDKTQCDNRMLTKENKILKEKITKLENNQKDSVEFFLPSVLETDQNDTVEV